MAIDLKDKPLVVVSDLDGTILDQQTYSYEQSRPAIDRLAQAEIPLILCSSKTAAEIIALQRELELVQPFICESGGAIYLPKDSFPFVIAAARPRRLLDVIEFGKRIFHLRQALQETAAACGVKVESFGTMSFPAIMARTGLTLEHAIHARQREYDEPFFLNAGDEAILVAKLRERGLTVTRGDRFYHLTGGHDKGQAVKALLEYYRRLHPSLVTIGLGNSANDLGLLRQTDIAVLVRNPDGSWDSEVTQHLPKVRCAEGIGPVGWREAVEGLLSQR